MTRRIARPRRVAAALLAVLATAGAVTVVGGDDDVQAQAAQGPVGVEAQIGPASGAQLLGPATASGVPGEVWATVDEDAASRVPKTVDGRELPETKDYVLRFRPDEGWRYVQAPLDETGAPYEGVLAGGRVTARGGLFFAGTDITRPESERRVALARDAEGPTRVLPAAPTGVLRPADASAGLAAETYSDGVLAARADAAGRTEGFVAIEGRDLQTGVARWSGTEWTRERICVAEDGTTPPAGCAASETLEGADAGLRATALATVEGGDAWLVARPAAASGRGVVLFRRTGSGADVRWVVRDLGAPQFSALSTPAAGISAVSPVAGAQSAVATTDGLWLDARFQQGGTERTATLRITAAGTRTFCDGGGCDATLGFALRTDSTSQAWADGTRVIGPVGGTTDRYATFDGTTWRVSAAFATLSGGVAFSSPTEGWLSDVHVTRDRPASPLAAWSVPARRPMTAVTSGPGAVGATETPALAVGLQGTVLRYTPGQGWDSEVRLGSSGVVRDDLRGVAWPEPSTAFAVGDEGAMWRWRKATNLWEADPAAPFDFTGHLTGVAFQPGDPERGFAVGRDGVLLRYGKSWEPMELPAALATVGPGGGRADLYGVAFAGTQALAAAGDGGVLVEDGGGWRVDDGAAALLKRAGSGARVLAVSGLPDGGAVAAGSAGDNRGLVLVRDSAGAPWRFTDQPPTGGVIAASAFRDGDRVRAVVSVTPRPWPASEDLTIPVFDPNSPAPRRPALSIPADGYLLRETPAGWRDEERTKLDSPTADPARKSDPILALLTDPAGRGWAVGGWVGGTDSLGRGPLPDEPPLEELQTAGVSRYDVAGPTGSSNVQAEAPVLAAGRARLLVGGSARCAGACSDLAPLDLSPDRSLTRALQLGASLAALPQGPRALAYAGGRVAVPETGSAPAAAPELQRFASLLAGSALPTFSAVAPGDTATGSTDAFQSALSSGWAPQGTGGLAAGTTPVELGAAAAPGRARTHYAVDLATGSGTVRLVTIDNAAGSLAAGGTNPAEDQQAWLRAVLADARTKGVPVVVQGGRSLDPRDDRAATDANATAALLRDGGASAYVYDGTGAQRRGAVPVGSTVTIPSFASGTLGYRERADVEGRGLPGLLLLELDVAARDATTNRAPATVRLLPVLEDLAVDAVDGRLLNRSQPALFQGLGRRPRAGEIGDPYVQLPNPLCSPSTRDACAATRLDPEVTFTSSDPDVLDFVRVDPTGTNPRKPFIDPATDKPVPDPTSGLVCPYNAGTTTISITSGGLTYRTTVTVRDGSVLRPCGTVPLNPARFETPASDGAAPPPPPAPAPAPSSSPAPSVVPLPPPVAATPVAGPVPPAAAPVPAVPSPSTPAPMASIPAFVTPVLAPPLAVPPPPAAASPAPPPGTSGASINVPVSQPVVQAERQKDEEVAEESSKAYATYDPALADRTGFDPTQGAALIALLIIGGAAGGTALGARRRRSTPVAYARSERTRHDRRPR